MALFGFDESVTKRIAAMVRRLERQPRARPSRPHGRRVIMSGAGAAFSGARAFRSAAQTISNDTWTAINFNDEAFDTDAYHDNSTNNTRLTISSAGYYLVGGSLLFAANSSGLRAIQIKHSTAGIVSYTNKIPVSPSISTSLETTAHLYYQTGGYYELECYQNSGGNLDVEYWSLYSPIFWITKLG